MQKFRIVSLVPSLTEMLVDLGLRSALVGVTKFCVHPASLRNEVEIIGGTKNPNLPKILRLAPTHIIANKEENNKDDVEFLAKQCNVHVSDVKTMNDVFELLKVYADLFKVWDKAMALDEALRRELTQLQTEVLYQPPIKVAYLIWKNPWMSVGHDTFIHEMLSIAGFTNVFAAHIRYPEVSLEQLSESDVVFLSSEPFPFNNTHLKEVKPFANRCFLVDGELFSWYGTRLLASFRYFKELRHEVETSFG